jgi:hypothetical protein
VAGGMEGRTIAPGNSMRAGPWGEEERGKLSRIVD